ncbi:hypothetical protein BGZ79_004207 [Entomortierella chlamydospora]|nr:hypothetical protein BGZ79_004207 [Entomortierella chlamydospora]
MSLRDLMPHRALMVSELRSQIGLFLIGCNKDIIACMLVCKAWRSDFRRLLYVSLVLRQRTRGPIITPLQWRSNSTYTQSLEIEEPTLIQRVSSTATRGARVGKGTAANSYGIKDQGTLRSLDYNMDPALDCSNLLHLTVHLNIRLARMCCWTRQEQDDWHEVGENGIIEQNTMQGDGQEQNSLFKTTTAVRYDVQNSSFLVKTSNRILALLHHNPQLKTFRWIGKSTTHIDHFSRYFLSERHSQLVELQLEELAVAVPEINRIIRNCPLLRRLHLHSPQILAESKWPELDINEAVGEVTSIAAHSATLSTVILTSTLAESVSLQQPPPQPSNIILDLSRIRFLVLKSPRFPLQNLLIHGPDLVELRISHLAKLRGTRRIIDPPSPPDSHQYGAHWDCPHLQTYECSNGTPDNSVYTTNLLESCRGSLTSISLISSVVAPGMATSLIERGHCQTLTHMNFSGASWIRSKEIQALLCNCPELIEFSGPHGVLWGEDLMESAQNWSCIKLKKLQMMICMARPDSDKWDQSTKQGRGPVGFPLRGIIGTNLSRYYPVFDTSELKSEQEVDQGSYTDDLRGVVDAVFYQLSQLTQLETLDLNGSNFSESQFLYEYPRGIPWTLEAGLDKLRNLSKMKHLVVTGWEDRMTRREARWLKKYWPDLQSTVNTSGNMSQGVHSSSDTNYSISGDVGGDDGSGDGEGSASGARDASDSEGKPDENQVVGWLAFRICLAQEWPERFPHIDPSISRSAGL